jgi:hypothetical protein
MYISVVRSSSQAGRIYVWPNVRELEALRFGPLDTRRAVEFLHLPADPQDAEADHFLVVRRAAPGKGAKLLVGENKIGFWGTTNASLRVPFGRKREVKGEITSSGSSEVLREHTLRTGVDVASLYSDGEPILVARIKADPLVIRAEPEASRTFSGQSIRARTASVSGAGIARLESAVRIINDAAREGTIHSLSVERKRLKIRVTQVIG